MALGSDWEATAEGCASSPSAFKGNAVSLVLMLAKAACCGGNADACSAPAPAPPPPPPPPA